MPSPSPSPKRNISPSQEAEIAANSVPTSTDTSGKRGLTGVAIGTPVLKAQYTEPGPKGRGTRTRKVYSKTQYTAGDGAKIFATLGNQEKVNLLAQLAQIPGLYAKNQAPTADYLRNIAASGVIAIREQDAAALEDIMRYADTVGDSYTDAIRNLLTNPQAAQGFFDMSGTRTGTKKKINLTPVEALALEVEQTALDYLDVKLNDKEKKAYAKRVNDLETKRGGALTSLERNQILIDTVQDKARELFAAEGENADSNLLRKGALGGTYNALKQAYSSYGVNVDNKTLSKQAIQGIRSKQALDNIMSKIQLQAQVSMPALREYIAQGLTPREALGNYIGLYSKIYGVPENEVSLEKLAPVWSGDKLMPYTDWNKYIYTMPEFKDSPLYKQQQLNDARSLIRNFIG
jgi:hypothetical protein